MKKDNKKIISGLILIIVVLVVGYMAVMLILDILKFLSSNIAKILVLGLIAWGVYWGIKHGKLDKYIDKIKK